MEENGKNYQLCEIQAEIGREMFKIAAWGYKNSRNGEVAAGYSRRESNSYGFEWQISAHATEKMLAISYIASPFFFAFA
ncbi:MAG: hypothetical protein IJW09_06300 [Clostridia bacterium]|nr:hypothetical protein [Clostridia bacterium]